MAEPARSSVPDEVTRLIAADSFARHLGVQLLALRPGYSKLVMDLRPHMRNFNGLAHGGAIFSLADAAFAAASNSHGTVAVALTMTIHFLDAPDTGARLVAEAVETRRGRRAAFYDVTVIEEGGKTIARCQGVVQRRDQALPARAGEAGRP